MIFSAATQAMLVAAKSEDRQKIPSREDFDAQKSQVESGTNRAIFGTTAIFCVFSNSNNSDASLGVPFLALFHVCSFEALGNY